LTASQNQHLLMAEMTKTCDPHIEREPLQVYLRVPGAFNFVSGRGYLSIYPNAGSNVRPQTRLCFADHQDRLT